MLNLFLLLRYLRKKKIVILSVAAVALSVSLLIVVTSLFTGFIEAFEQAAVKTSGDVILEPPVKMKNYALLIKRLEALNSIQAATAAISSQALLHLGRGKVTAVSLWGIDPAGRNRVTGFKNVLLKQKNLTPEPSFKSPDSKNKTGGFVGIGVIAEPNEITDEYDFTRIKEMLGRDVVLTTGSVMERKYDGPAGQNIKRKVVKFTVADIVYTGVYWIDKNFVYLPIDSLQKELYPDQSSPVADQIQIKLADGTKTEKALAQIWAVWERFAEDELDRPKSWIQYTDIVTSKQLQSGYVTEIMKQMGVLILIFAVISLGIVLLVFCIFYMIVQQKQRDIAIIKSCGTSGTSVACLFLSFGLSVGIIGSALGTLLGCIITRNINTVENYIRIIFGLKLWKSSIYLFSSIPNHVNWYWGCIIIVAAVIAVAVGSLIPAVVAARTRPVNILRYE